MPYIYLGVFGVNILLFIMKLYIGLASNSISVYSDGVNNFFDSLTGILSFALLVSLARQTECITSYRIKKTEQFLSFVISATVAFSAFYFAYNSLERLTYPTPVSFAVRYLVVIIATAVIKLIMFVVLGFCAKKSGSGVIRLISLDSLLDFFITSVTALTLILSMNGKYAFDALCGLVISAVILFTAVKNLFSAISFLTELPAKKVREKLTDILRNENVIGINFNLSDDENEVYIKIKTTEEKENLGREIEKETALKAYIIVCEE